MRWTYQEYLNYENRRARANPEPERPAADALPSAGQREAPPAGRCLIRVTGYRRRLLDPDNFIGGFKYMLDCLRYAGLIPDDTPEAIRLEASQRKVSRKADERTEIEILPD